MSTIWTPDGEYRPQDANPQVEDSSTNADTDEELDAQREEQLREAEHLTHEIREADPAIIVANHCYGFFELAAIHLSTQPPNLVKASLAIDSLSAVVEKVGPRLGDYATELTDGLAQLRLAYIQLSSLPSDDAKLQN